MAQALKGRTSTDPVAEDVKRSVYSILKAQPYFFPIVASMRIALSEDVPTLAVSQDEDLVVNPEFWSTLFGDDKAVVLIHEALHVALNHHYRAQNMGSVDATLWNIATDCVINRYLRTLFPDSKVLREGVSEELVHELIARFDPGLASRITVDDLRRMNEEQIYSILKRAVGSARLASVAAQATVAGQKSEEQPEAEDKGSGAGRERREMEKKEGEGSGEEQEKQGKSEEGSGRGEKGEREHGDERGRGKGAEERVPDLPVDKTLEKGGIMREVKNVRSTVEPIARRVRSAESPEAEKSVRRIEAVAAIRDAIMSIGVEAGDLLESLDNLVPRGRINWTEYLVYSVAKVTRERLVSTWSVPHRRFPELVPGYKRLPGRGVRMIVAVDVSGSIDTYTLRRFLEETLWAYQLMGDRVDGEVWFWDAEIQGKVPLKELAENLRVTVTGRGGTVIDPVADELLEEVEKNPVDVFVVFTDGLVVLEDPDKFNEALRRVQLPIIVYTIQPIEELGATQIHYPVEE